LGYWVLAWLGSLVVPAWALIATFAVAPDRAWTRVSHVMGVVFFAGAAGCAALTWALVFAVTAAAVLVRHRDATRPLRSTWPDALVGALAAIGFGVLPLTALMSEEGAGLGAPVIQLLAADAIIAALGALSGWRLGVAARSAAASG
jgi:hypothetical protein